MLKSSARSLIVVYLKGVCMGAADAVPGVSGGTIALITGIYERLITALTAIRPGRIKAVLLGVRPGGVPRAILALRAMDAGFLLALGAGIMTAVVAVASVVNVAVEVYPVPTFGFLLGLIAASAVVLTRGSNLIVDTPGRAGAAVAGFVFAFVLSGQAADGFGHGPLVTFIAGAIAVSAMVLPGVSGSLLLLMLGQYTYLLGVVASVRDGVFAGEAAVSEMMTAGVFIAGAFVGLFTVAHVVRRALDRWREATLIFLVSLIVGALRAPLLRIDQALTSTGAGWTAEAIALVAVTAIAGAIPVIVLERWAGGIKY